MKNAKIDLVILVGGKGLRVKKYTKKIPKPMLPINKKPFLDYLIKEYAKYNFENIFLLAGYKGHKIFNRYNNKIINLTKIKCIVEKRELDTYGALNNAKIFLKNDFILVNGDSFLKFSINKLINKKYKKCLTMILIKNKNYLSNKKLNKLNINKNGNVIFSNKNYFMNSGVYYVKRKIFYIYKNKKLKISFENEIIPQLIKREKVGGLKINGFFIDIGTYENLKKAKGEIPKLFNKPAVFFDRDGVINYDNHYVHKIKDFKFKPQVIRTLRYLSKKNIYLFIVTNQAGIAKGYFTEKDFLLLHKKLKINFLKNDIYFNEIVYSPYHPQAVINKYRRISNYRKPGNLMIEKLIKNWPIIKKKSFMIGDQISDKIAAETSNLYFEYPKKKFYNQINKICKKLLIN